MTSFARSGGNTAPAPSNPNVALPISEVLRSAETPPDAQSDDRIFSRPEAGIFIALDGNTRDDTHELKEVVGATGIRALDDHTFDTTNPRASMVQALIECNDSVNGLKVDRNDIRAITGTLVKFFDQPDGRRSVAVGQVGHTRTYLDTGTKTQMLMADEVDERGHLLNGFGSPLFTKLSQDNMLQVHVFHIEQGDRFLVTTAGLTKEVDQSRRIFRKFRKALQAKTPEEAIAQLSQNVAPKAPDGAPGKISHAAVVIDYERSIMDSLVAPNHTAAAVVGSAALAAAAARGASVHGANVIALSPPAAATSGSALPPPGGPGTASPSRWRRMLPAGSQRVGGGGGGERRLWKRIGAAVALIGAVALGVYGCSELTEKPHSSRAVATSTPTPTSTPEAPTPTVPPQPPVEDTPPTPDTAPVPQAPVWQPQFFNIVPGRATANSIENLMIHEPGHDLVGYRNMTGARAHRVEQDIQRRFGNKLVVGATSGKDVTYQYGNEVRLNSTREPVRWANQAIEDAVRADILQYA